ncbi:MAG: putative glycoside hydrolase, partial [bacterium]|nr:putative glycoside hydrolase [bacterium]
LRSPTGAHVSWWPQTWLINITSHAPAVDGVRWPDAFASFVASEIASQPVWDGVYFDNLWSEISWFTRDAIDLDGDGRVEDPATRNQWWSDGVRAILTATRARVRPGFLITGNGSATYAPFTNGLLFEHFPTTSEGGWSASMAAYASTLAYAAAPALAILNSNTGNTGTWNDWAHMRFGLTSALLGDGYSSFDFGDQDHAQLWTYDEYDAALGAPKGAPRIVNAAVGSQANAAFPSGVYRRDFTNGLAVVNATDRAQAVALDGEYERMHGVQDPITNDGRIVTDIVLPAHDGLVLLRPIADIVGAPFTNGAFARVFRSDGVVARTGFFAYDSGFRGGTTIERVDVDGDGILETIIGDATMIRVRAGTTERLAFAPFGSS